MQENPRLEINFKNNNPENPAANGKTASFLNRQPLFDANKKQLKSSLTWKFPQLIIICRNKKRLEIFNVTAIAAIFHAIAYSPSNSANTVIDQMKPQMERAVRSFIAQPTSKTYYDGE
jgi:hypothetical protein